jgi:serine O-acetyltransferase
MRSAGWRAAWQQIDFLGTDIQRMVRGRWWRYLSVLFSAAFALIAFYRMNRALYLLLGSVWSGARVLLSPIVFLIRPWMAGCEIHYQAEIGRGLMVLHPEMGIVVSKHAMVGSEFTMTGGNIIGVARAGLKHGDILLGDSVLLGANAVVLGPIRLGNRVVVAAGAVAVRDMAEDLIAGGVPARPISVRPRPKGRGPEERDTADGIQA